MSESKYYLVGIREVHVSHRIVKADSLEEAEHDAGGGTEIFCEYSHTLDPDTWTWEELTKEVAEATERLWS